MKRPFATSDHPKTNGLHSQKSLFDRYPKACFWCLTRCFLVSCLLCSVKARHSSRLHPRQLPVVGIPEASSSAELLRGFATWSASCTWPPVVAKHQSFTPFLTLKWSYFFTSRHPFLVVYVGFESSHTTLGQLDPQPFYITLGDAVFFAPVNTKKHHDSYIYDIQIFSAQSISYPSLLSKAPNPAQHVAGSGSPNQALH